MTTALANTFGTAFRVTTFGESHGGGVGCVVDGVPPRLQLSNAELQARPACTSAAGHHHPTALQPCRGSLALTWRRRAVSHAALSFIHAPPQFELDRRRPGQSRITTPRNEEDTCEILSGAPRVAPCAVVVAAAG